MMNKPLSKYKLKLDYTKVQLIRQQAEQGVTHGAIAREFGVTVGTVGKVVRRETWQEIPALLLPQADLEAQMQRIAKLQEQVNNLNGVQETVQQASAPPPPNPLDEEAQPLPRGLLPVSPEVEARANNYLGKDSK